MVKLKLIANNGEREERSPDVHTKDQALMLAVLYASDGFYKAVILEINNRIYADISIAQTETHKVITIIQPKD